MCTLVIFPDNCGTNTGLYDWSWSTEPTYPGLLSVYFLMDPDLFPFVLHYHLLSVTNTNNKQRSTQSFRSINIDGRTPIFANLRMDLGWR